MKNKRLTLLFCVVVLLLGLKYFDSGSSATPEVIQAVSTRSPKTPLETSQSTEAGSEPGIWPARSSNDGDIVDLFAPPKPPAPVVVSVPAPPVVTKPKTKAAVAVVPPPQAPVAPPLPFTVVGDWTEDGKTVVFLSGSQGTFSAHTDDVLLGNYKVNRVQPGLIAFTYLPLQEIQQLSWRASP